MKNCKDCKHCRPTDPWALWFVPVIGWIIVLLHMCGRWRWEYAMCRIGLKSDGPVYSPKYCKNSRHYGPCGPSASLFEPRA